MLTGFLVFVIGVLAFLLWRTGGLLNEVLDHNIAMAVEYKRMSEEYKQYRKDVVDSLEQPVKGN